MPLLTSDRCPTHPTALCSVVCPSVCLSHHRQEFKNRKSSKVVERLYWMMMMTMMYCTPSSGLAGAGCFCRLHSDQSCTFFPAPNVDELTALTQRVVHVCVCWFRLFKSNAQGRPFGPSSGTGDKIGCGVNLGEVISDDAQRRMVPVVFTRNGNEALLLLFILLHYKVSCLSVCSSFQTVPPPILRLA